MKRPKDHYVAQTYLKWFANEQKSLWVYGKKWPGVKSKSPAQICKEPGGSDNPFLQKNRAIEAYLAPIENNWNDHIRFLTSATETSSQEYLNAKLTVCCYMAYLRFHTPATVRIEQAALSAILRSTLKLLNDAGELPPPPADLQNIADTIDESCFTVDGKFPRAIAAGILPKAASNFFKSPMMLLHNESEMPLLTSDNPLCLWHCNDATYPTLYLPLTPRTAVLVKPFIEKERTANYDHSLDHAADPKPELIKILNEQTAKHAEQIVISNQQRNDVLALVAEYKDWHFANLTTTLSIHEGDIIINTSRAIKKDL